MDTDERLTALKKAYADIILNTAKEAAARILVSERKALRFQHDLFVAKEDAIQMLIRLKQMMDSKVSAAAMTSLSQQSKIEELEAQLQEAEDIVKDLREELREVQAELEKVTNNKEQNMDEHESQQESVSVPDMTNLNLNENSEGPKCYNGGKPDLPSVKEPELYRNGCTQRIRACERNMLDANLPLSGQNDVKEVKEGERICTAPKHEDGKVCNIEKKVGLEDGRLNRWDQIQASFIRMRKRGTRYRKNRIPSCRYLPDQNKKMDQAPDIICSNSNPKSVKSTALSEEDPSKMDPKLPTDTTEVEPHPGCAETTESDGAFVKTCDVQITMNNGESSIDKLVHTESSGVPVCEMDLEKVKMPLVSSVPKSSDPTIGVPSQPVNDRIIKYTFQRKRKKEPVSSSNGSASVEKSTLKRKMGEKQNGSVEPLKSISITESSRDSRRLAQVARQLISLSEKKWWQ